MLDGERTVQAHLHEADLLAMRVEVVDDLLGNVAERTHADDDAVGIGGAIVVEEAVVGAELLVDLVHVLLDDGGERVVGGVACLAVLEEGVVVLVRAACVRMLGVEAVVAEGFDGIHVDHVGQVGVIPLGDLLDLM